MPIPTITKFQIARMNREAEAIQNMATQLCQELGTNQHKAAFQTSCKLGDAIDTLQGVIADVLPPLPPSDIIDD